MAGDSGFLTRDGRAQIEGRVELVQPQRRHPRPADAGGHADLPEILDELTDGTGDGCVSVERTRLEGVTDHVTIHANHAELIRAPLLFPDPGPVACMPFVLGRLKADRERNGQRHQK